MAVPRMPGPNDSTAQVRGTAPAATAEGFPITCDADRVAVLVAYTLLGATLNGFAPV
jgi:hypothetical protein